MARLLPSTPDLSAAEEPDPRVIGVDSESADELLAALSSATSRRLLAALHDEPAPPARLAERVDTSLQNAQYHLGKLEAADLIEVVDTIYSEKGREMNVYAPSDRPLVMVAGNEDATTGLREALSGLLGALGVLGLVSLIVQHHLVGLPFPFGAAAGGDGGGGGGAGLAVETAAREGGDRGMVAMEAATKTPAAGGGGTLLPLELLAEPGMVFFAGGALMLLAFFVGWHWRVRR